jgi:hypothetical protein
VGGREGLAGSVGILPEEGLRSRKGRQVSRYDYHEHKSRNPPRWVPVVADEVLKETERSFLLLIDGEEIWIPKSQVNNPDVIGQGELDVEIEVTEWIARQKGIVE